MGVIEDIQKVSKTIADLKVRIQQNTYAKQLAWDSWRDCENQYSRRKLITTCRENKEKEVNMYQSRIDSDQQALKTRQQELESLQSQLEADQESQQILAEQGLTTEAVMQQAQIEADAKAQATKSKGQAVKYVIILVGLAIVSLLIYYFVNKIRKGKSKK